MRKNRMMRLASVLLVLCLLTTSVISGTFAKYVTTVGGRDEARVARWGFTGENADIAITELFKETYILPKSIVQSWLVEKSMMNPTC